MICFLFNILNGEHDARCIKRNKKINHFGNAALYCLLIVPCCFFNDVAFSFADIPVCFSLLALRPLVFDQYLNIRRKKGLIYQPKVPESAVDKFENALFGKNAWHISNAIYLCVFVGGWLWWESVK